MTHIRTFFPGRIVAMWLLLVVATLITWVIGYRQVVTGAPELSSAIILIIAMVKADLVGRYFMELRDAAAGLRIAFDAWCLGVCALLLGVFYFA
jgi:caa(3)-type oxidase subunit IV